MVAGTGSGSIAIDGNGRVVVNAVNTAPCAVAVNNTATLAINPGKCIATNNTITVNGGATLEVAESGTVVLGGDLTLVEGEILTRQRGGGKGAGGIRA